jgi:hypothetical protein
LRVEITLCMYKYYSSVSLLHSWVSYSHAYVSKLLSCVCKPHSASKIKLCVWKSYSACRNQSCACWNHTRACFYHVRACHCVYKLHSACRNNTRECHIHTHTSQNSSRVCENHTLSVKSHSGCEIVLCVYKSHSCVLLLHSWVSYSHAYTKPHSACKIKLVLFLRLEINLVRIEIILVSVVFTRIRVKITLVCMETTFWV